MSDKPLFRENEILQDEKEARDKRIAELEKELRFTNEILHHSYDNEWKSLKRVKELEAELDGLLSQDTSEWKSAAFQKIKTLESDNVALKKEIGELQAAAVQDAEVVCDLEYARQKREAKLTEKDKEIERLKHEFNEDTAKLTTELCDERDGLQHQLKHYEKVVIPEFREGLAERSNLIDAKLLLQHSVKVLGEALEKYGNHKDECYICEEMRKYPLNPYAIHPNEGLCNCGYRQAIKDINHE